METKFKSLFRKGYLLIIVFIVSFLLATGIQITREARGQFKSFKDEMSIHDVWMDKEHGGSQLAPKIPKGWRFIGVSNGEKINMNNLWFQDNDGNIYLVQGILTNRFLSLHHTISRISSE